MSQYNDSCPVPQDITYHSVSNWHMIMSQYNDSCPVPQDITYHSVSNWHMIMSQYNDSCPVPQDITYHSVSNWHMIMSQYNGSCPVPQGIRYHSVSLSNWPITVWVNIMIAALSSRISLYQTPVCLKLVYVSIMVCIRSASSQFQTVGMM